jgi:excisionase family DNA binding protein
MKLISSAQAAKKLGVHITRVQVLIREGRLPAKQVGGTYVINEADLRLVSNRKPGRPPLNKELQGTRNKRIKQKKAGVVRGVEKKKQSYST